MNWILGIDTGVLQYLFSIRTPSLTDAMIALSAWNEWTILLPFTIIVAIVLCVWKRWFEALCIMLAVFGSGTMVFVIKQVVMRARPDIQFRAIEEIGYSFPSAHAALSLTLYGFLAYLLTTRTKRRSLQILIWGGSIALSLAVGFSRLYLGVHYGSDVVAGYVIGGLFLWLGIRIATRAKIGA